MTFAEDCFTVMFSDMLLQCSFMLWFERHCPRATFVVMHLHVSRPVFYAVKPLCVLVFIALLSLLAFSCAATPSS